MVVDYIEAQKRVIDVYFNSAVWIPYVENNYRMYRQWFSPKIPAEIYARTVSNIADNIAASTRITNNIVFGNIDSFGNAFERAQQNTRELSRINVNAAKVFQDTARETARISPNRKYREEYIK
jgi:lysine/ornithine N-monooxygenase